MESDTTLSQVVSLSKHFHSYRERSRDSRQTTMGCSKQQFFCKGSARKLCFGKANLPQAGSNTEKLHPRSTIHKLTLPVIWGSPRGNPRQASSTSQHLYGSPCRHNPSYTECRQTCRRENSSVHTKLAQANPRSVDPGYCSGISSTSSSMARPTATYIPTR